MQLYGYKTDLEYEEQNCVELGGWSQRTEQGKFERILSVTKSVSQLKLLIYTYW
jgi:hypothetical protein